MKQAIRRWVSFFLLLSALAAPSSVFARRHGNSSDEAGKTEHVRSYKTKKGKAVKAYKRHPKGTAHHHKR